MVFNNKENEKLGGSSYTCKIRFNKTWKFKKSYLKKYYELSKWCFLFLKGGRIMTKHWKNEFEKMEPNALTIKLYPQAFIIIIITAVVAVINLIIETKVWLCFKICSNNNNIWGWWLNWKILRPNPLLKYNVSMTKRQNTESCKMDQAENFSPSPCCVCICIYVNETISFKQNIYWDNKFWSI